MRSILLLVLVGCATESTLPAEQLAPAPGFDNFVPGEMVANSPTRVTWTDPDLIVGSTANLFVSINGLGSGPCPPVLMGDCADLATPIIRVARGTVQPSQTLTGRSGTTYESDPYVIFDVTPPSGLMMGQVLGFQAAGMTSAGLTLSPAAEKTAGFGFCPFILAPTCGPDGTEYSNDCLAIGAGAVVVTQPGEGC